MFGTCKAKRKDYSESENFRNLLTGACGKSIPYRINVTLPLMIPSVPSTQSASK